MSKNPYYDEVVLEGGNLKLDFREWDIERKIIVKVQLEIEEEDITTLVPKRVGTVNPKVGQWAYTHKKAWPVVCGQQTAAKGRIKEIRAMLIRAGLTELAEMMLIRSDLNGVDLVKTPGLPMREEKLKEETNE